MSVEIVVALLALIGVIVSSIFQFKSSQTAQQTNREREQAAELEKAKNTIKEKEDEKFRTDIMRDIRTLTENQKLMQKNLSGEIKTVTGRIDDIKNRVSTRIEELEMSIEMISTISVENARHYSTMLKMFETTNQKVGTLINLESQNLRYSKKIGEALIDMGEVIQDTIEDESIVKKLDSAIEAAASVRADMIDNLISINGNMMQTSQSLTPTDESDYVKETVQKIDRVRKKSNNYEIEP